MKPRQVLLVVLFIALAFPLVFGGVAVPGVVGGSSSIYSLSRLGGLLGMILFGMLFVLGTKPKFIETFFGHDKMIALHRKLCVTALVLVLFHGIVGIWNAYGGGTGLLLGVVAFFLLIITFLFIVLQKIFHWAYEFWTTIHQLTYILFPPAYLHSLLLGTSLRSSLVWQIIWVLLGIEYLGILGYKIWNARQNRKNRFQVTQVIQETPNIWTLQFQPEGGSPFSYLPGQFLILYLSQAGRMSDPHPFTIASSPTREILSVSIKEAGDFTGNIGRTITGDYALIDGPYGRFSFLHYPAEEYIFIAGGIGITPFLSMLRYMRDRRIKKKILLLWGNRTERDIAFREELNRMERTMTGLKVVHVLSDQGDWRGESGFINASLIQKYGDIRGQEIFLCGPPLMMKLVQKELRSFNLPKQQIHFERFAW